MVNLGFNRIDVIRTAVASLVLLAIVTLSLMGFAYGTSSVFTIGGVTFISPLELNVVILSTGTVPINLIIPSVASILVIVFAGRFFCGWICPTGILLEYSHFFTVRKERKSVGGLWSNREKYAVLFAVLLSSAFFNFSALYLFSPPSLAYRFLSSFVKSRIISQDVVALLVIFLLDFFAVRYGRSWCNTLCPLGTVISSLSFVNWVKPKVDKEKCIDFDFNCLDCWRVCPMRIPLTSWLAERERRWVMMECNKCLKCWANCPEKAIKIQA